MHQKPNLCNDYVNEATYKTSDLLQTWSSRDLSLGLETRFYKSCSWSWTLESWSWSWNPRVSVSVLVLGPWRLGLHHLWSMKLRQNKKSYVKLQRENVQSAASIARKSPVRQPPLLLWNGYLATVVCWCEQTGLEWVTTCCQSWSTCDATISCKFSCCCTVVISL